MEIYVYRYEHVDYIPQTEKGSFELFKKFHENDYEKKTLNELKNLYNYERNQIARACVRNGWEGDGKLMCIWFPPFINHNLEETYGSYIWHVKQQSNGTSFLAFINYPPDLRVFRNLFSDSYEEL